MYVIVGLGNPTSKYEKTRHNVGFDVIDKIAAQYNIAVKEMSHKALIGKGMINGEKVILVKPMTFMNLSGDSVVEILNYYKMDSATELIVLVDDIALPCGSLRIRRKGSAGGHNGLKSIIERCGTQEFMRIKVGVGEVPEHSDIINHVLGRFSKDDRILVEQSMDRAVEAVACIVDGQLDKAMNNYNGKG